MNICTFIGHWFGQMSLKSATTPMRNVGGNISGQFMRNIKQLIWGLAVFICSCGQYSQGTSKTNDSLTNKKSSQPS
jgi:hypothetical protein